jgi:hypothetical protein
MNKVIVSLLLLCAAMMHTHKSPVEYVLKAVELIDKVFFGFWDLNENLTNAYTRKVSHTMKWIKTDTGNRMRRAALATFRWNKCMLKVEQSMNAELNIGLRRIAAELTHLSRDFVTDERTTRMLAKLKLVRLLQAATNGAAWDHITLFNEKWVLAQEAGWVLHMGIELAKDAVQLRANFTQEVAEEEQHERERPQRIKQYIADMAMLFTAVNFLGLFQQ